ncbi:diaminopimelate epimerase [Methanococcus voltae]|uniref:Diaminopimelate epimerase n=3 Tax=Methanococcus voltae TaxID=2188 RepID=A0A8J7USV7_METVO|nr:diaminopimelate epimerase [Methanococcus voltae]MCS3921761.1 diaminopimelate epimerase [Methanococcus voltae PS]
MESIGFNEFMKSKKYINLEFTKMHALGNDYIVFNELDSLVVPEELKGEFSNKICKRGFSVGADGVIFVQKPSKIEIDYDADVRFRIFNSDGSEAEMCGNGIRCFSKYVHERTDFKNNPLRVQSEGGLRISEMEFDESNKDFVKNVRVYMGNPKYAMKDIPMAIENIAEDLEFMNLELPVNCECLKKIGKEALKLSVANVGNPHAVIILQENNLDVEFIRKNLNELGGYMECHPAFPEKINVHFINLINENEIQIITWERGAGYTTACGTGTTSSVAVCEKLSKTGCKVLAHLDGGDLEIEIVNNGNDVYMKGGAEISYDGILKNL